MTPNKSLNPTAPREFRGHNTHCGFLGHRIPGAFRDVRGNGADMILISWVLLTLGGEAGRLMPWYDWRELWFASGPCWSG